MPLKAEFFGSYADARKIPSDNRPQIAFAGRSNVGKSSLLNKIVGRKKLAKTSKTPGRTQLINLFLVNEVCFFVDLPGYGYARASVEARRQWGKLVDSYLDSSPSLKGLCFLLDCRRDPNEDDLMMVDWLQSRNIEYIIVLTKADKLSKSRLLNRCRQIEKAFKSSPIPFSIVSGIGKKELLLWIEGITGKQK
nr:YihA family ribosome biogenesis GTP-binding protein [candidate division Zixibacteria bacterium]